MSRPNMCWMFGSVLLCAALMMVARTGPPQLLASAEPISARTSAVVQPQGKPKLEIDQTRYSFGMMDVDQSAEHWFTLRNVGDGELQLRLGATSCTCTLGELENQRVPPGGEARVRLAWTPPKPAELFAQGTTIHTNDPQRPSVYLNVVGRVRAHLAASPDGLAFSEVPWGESASRKLLVYSQAWNSFSLEAVCDDPSFDIQVAPADESELAQLQARAGYAVTVKTPAGRAKGAFKAQLRLNATPGGAAAHARQLKLPIQGVICSRLSIQGPGLQSGSKLELGTVWRGQSQDHALSIFVRGPHEHLVLDDLQARPTFLHVKVGPREQLSEMLARYKLHIQVPSNAPISRCLGAAAGEISFRTNHEDVSELRIRVEFAVLERP